MVKELFENIFNIDSRFFATLKNLWRPHFLAREYIKGKRQKYLLPIQAFLFSSFLLIFFILYFVDLNKVIKLSQKDIVVQSEALGKYDELAPILIKNKEAEDSLRRHIFKSVLNKEDNLFPVAFKSFHKFQITYDDVYKKKVDSIFIEKKVSKNLDKLILKQLIKFEFNPIGASKFLVSMITWGVLINIFVIAFLSKFLYFRRKMFFVEHLTFNICLHTSIICATLVCLPVFLRNDGKSSNWWPDSSAVTSAFLLFALWSFYSFYKPGFIKNTLKFIFLLFVYFISLSLSCLFISALNFLFFI
jgi:hypothetical protein